MNQDIFKGMWKQLEGQVKTTWGKLTSDDLKQIDGNREKLVGKLEERYGWSKSEADAQVDRFLAEHDQGSFNNSPHM